MFIEITTALLFITMLTLLALKRYYRNQNSHQKLYHAWQRHTKLDLNPEGGLKEEHIIARLKLLAQLERLLKSEEVAGMMRLLRNGIESEAIVELSHNLTTEELILLIRYDLTVDNDNMLFYLDGFSKTTDEPLREKYKKCLKILLIKFSSIVGYSLFKISEDLALRLYASKDFRFFLSPHYAHIVPQQRSQFLKEKLLENSAVKALVEGDGERTPTQEETRIIKTYKLDSLNANELVENLRSEFPILDKGFIDTVGAGLLKL